jgi:hypothetical protein
MYFIATLIIFRLDLGRGYFYCEIIERFGKPGLDKVEG